MLSNFLRSFNRSSRRQRPSRRSTSSRSSTASISSSTASNPSITKPSRHFCRTGKLHKKKENNIFKTFILQLIAKNIILDIEEVENPKKTTKLLEKIEVLEK